MVGTLSGARHRPTLMLLHGPTASRPARRRARGAAAVRDNLMASVARCPRRRCPELRLHRHGQNCGAIVLDLILEAKIPLPHLAVAIGFYLPLGLHPDPRRPHQWAVSLALPVTPPTRQKALERPLRFRPHHGRSHRESSLQSQSSSSSSRPSSMPFLDFGQSTWSKLLGTVLLAAIALWMFYVALEKRSQAADRT